MAARAGRRCQRRQSTREAGGVRRQQRRRGWIYGHSGHEWGRRKRGQRHSAQGASARLRWGRRRKQEVQVAAVDCCSAAAATARSVAWEDKALMTQRRFGRQRRIKEATGRRRGAVADRQRGQEWGQRRRRRTDAHSNGRRERRWQFGRDEPVTAVTRGLVGSSGASGNGNGSNRVCARYYHLRQERQGRWLRRRAAATAVVVRQRRVSGDEGSGAVTRAPADLGFGGSAGGGMVECR